MTLADQIAAAIAQTPATADLLSRLAPEVQENVKGGWLAAIQAELDAAAPPVVVEPVAPTQEPAAPAAPVVVETTPVVPPATPAEPAAAVEVPSAAAPVQEPAAAPQS